tara:strand:- start:6925 stop:8073 length:1149 start_codon:yes stop_codon:yes gene_type:complete
LGFKLSLRKIIIGPAYPLRGGISESNDSLFDSFKSKGDDVRIISFSLQYPNLLFPGKNQYTKSNTKVSNSTELINTLNPFSWIKVAIQINKIKPDYVIVRYWHPYFALCLGFICAIIKIFSIKVIAWVDNVHPHESFPLQKFLTNFFFSFCDSYLVMSSSVKDQLRSLVSKKKIRHVPHPIYNVFGGELNKNKARELLKLETKSSKKYLLFFGLIRKYKGLDLLLNAMASKQLRDLDLSLIVAGEFYGQKSHYVDLINKFKINNRVILYDYYIPNEMVPSLFCSADIVVQPYLNATQSGVSMIAYNFCKPMILTNVGGLSEYVDHKKNGYLIEPNSIEIVNALVDFYKNNREKEFSSDIRSKRDLFSWEALAKSFDELYEVT